MSQSAITFLILGAVVVLFVSNLVPVAVVSVAAALARWATGILDINQDLAGFGNPTVLFIASLFVVSEGLDATGVTGWVGQQLVAKAGTSRTPRRAHDAAVRCADRPDQRQRCRGGAAPGGRRHGRPAGPAVVAAAQPLAFAAHAGSMLALTGTPVNVLVSEAAEDAGLDSFGFFEFAVAGIPLLVGTIAIVVFLGPRLLPSRNSFGPIFVVRTRGADG